MANKIAPVEVTRDTLEGYIWRATGWRGDARPIDAILVQVDRYTAAQVRHATRDAASAQQSAEIERLEGLLTDTETQLATQTTAKQMTMDILSERNDQLAAARTATQAEREAKETALAARDEAVLEMQAAVEVKETALETVSELTRRLVEQSESAATAVRAAQAAVEAVPPAPVIERVAVNALLELLQTVHEKATGAVDVSAGVLLAVDALNAALRASDGFVKDIEHSPEGAALVVAHEARHAEALAAAEEYAAEFEAEHGPISDAAVAEAEAFLNGLEDGLTDTARKLPKSVCMGHGPGDLSEREGFGEPEPEADPVLAAIVEVQAEATADADEPSVPLTQKVCTKCGLSQPYDQFYKDKQAADGHKGSCKACERRHNEEKRVAAAAAKAAKAAPAAPVKVSAAE